MSRPPYGSHSGSRHACQKRPTSQCGWTRRAAAQTVVAQRVPGRAGNALLRDRGNESLRRRLSEGAPSRGAHAGYGFIVGGSSSRAETWLASALCALSGEVWRQGSVSHRKKQRYRPERWRQFVMGQSLCTLQTCDNTRRNAAEGLKGKSLAAAKRDFPVRVSAELEQEMISCSSCSISKRPISRDVSATFGKMEVASQTMRTDVVLI